MGFSRLINGLKSIRSGVSNVVNAAKNALKGATQGQNYQKRADSHMREHTAQARTQFDLGDAPRRPAPRTEEPKSRPSTPPRAENTRPSQPDPFWGSISSQVSSFGFDTGATISVQDEEQTRAFEQALREKEEEEKRKKNKLPDPFEEESPSEPPVPPGGGSPPSPPRDNGAGGFGSGSADEWLHSGKMKLIDRSTNIYGISYDINSQTLFVQFKHWEPGMDWMEHSGPGSVYRYDDVDESEALDFYKTASKGCWVWNNLRVHGRWGGYQKEYDLVRVPSSYVPRVAITASSGDWWVPRSCEAGTSTLEARKAIPLYVFARWREAHEKAKRRAMPNRGEPNRARPRSYRPNNGRPY